MERRADFSGFYRILSARALHTLDEGRKSTHRVHARRTVQRRGARAVCSQRWDVDIARYIGTKRTRLSSPPGCAVRCCIVWQCAVEGRKRFRHCEVEEKRNAEDGSVVAIPCLLLRINKTPPRRRRRSSEEEPAAEDIKRLRYKSGCVASPFSGFPEARRKSGLAGSTSQAISDRWSGALGFP